MGYFRTVRKKIGQPVKVSLGLKIRPLTDYDLSLCPMLLVIFINLVIFLAVCWEIWQVHLFDKFTLIFDLTEKLLLNGKIYQPSSRSNRINLSSSEKNKLCISLIWRKQQQRQQQEQQQQ